MNPLLVTFSPLIINNVGNHNREELIKSGFDSIFFRPNQKISRLLSKRFFVERGNPKVHWDAGINAIPVSMALKFNIKLLFYAEHGESEYGGRVLDEEKKKVQVQACHVTVKSCTEGPSSRCAGSRLAQTLSACRSKQIHIDTV